MNVVHIIWELNIGGAETMLADILNEQVKSCNVSLIVINKFHELSIIKSIDRKVKLYCIGRLAGSRNIIPIVKLNLIILSISPDIIHCHNKDIIRIILFRRIKSICTIHGLGRSKQYLEKYNCLVAISNTVKMDLKNFLNLEAVRIYNGIELSGLKIRHLSIKKDSIKILSVGRLIHGIKGQHILLRALGYLNNKNIYLDIVGEGPSKDYLLTEIHNMKVPNTRLIGIKTRKWIYSNMCNYDLVIQPSLNEGFGLVLIEAMAAKVPLLVSDISAHIELLNGNEFGTTYSKLDISELATKIELAANDIKHYSDTLDMARKHVEEKFTIQNTAEQYLELYKTIYSANR